MFQVPDDRTFTLHHGVLFVRLRDALWVGGTPDYDVGVRDLEAYPERVTPLVRVAPWLPVWMPLKLIPFRMKDILRLSLSRYWISEGTELVLPITDDVARFQALGDCGLLLSPTGSEPVIILRMTMEEKTDIVVTPQLDLRVLGDSRDQGGRRYPRFRDAVALLRETEFEDWPHLGSRATKEFHTSIRDGSGNLENYHTNWVYRSGVSEGSAVCHSHAILYESLRLFIGYDQVDVSSLAGMGVLFGRIQNIRISLVWSSCSTRPLMYLEQPPPQSSIVGTHRPSETRLLC